MLGVGLGVGVGLGLGLGFGLGFGVVRRALHIRALVLAAHAAERVPLPLVVLHRVVVHGQLGAW